MAQREVGNLRTRLSWEGEGAQRSLQAFSRDLRGLRSEMNEARSRGQAYTRSLEGLRRQQDILNRSVRTQQERVRELKKRYDEARETKGENARETQRLATQYNNASAQLNRMEGELKDVTREIERQTNPWNRLGDQMDSAGQRMKRFGDTMSDFGRSYSLRVTAPIVAGGTAVFKAAMEYESAFAGVAKTFSGTEAQLASLNDGIRQMAKEIPASTTEIAGVAEAAGQLGIEAESIEEFTRTMIDLGEATNLTSEQAATEFARFANIVGMSQEDFDRMGSSIVALGNSMATTESEISSMAMRLAAQGSQVGMTEAQILALAGTMSSLGIEAEAGGTAMTSVLKKMQTAVADNGAEVKLWAKAAEMSVSDFRKAFEDDAIGALDALIKGLANSADEGENLTSILADLGIKGIRESDTMLRLAGASDLLTEAVNTSTTAWKDNTALSEEAAQRYETTESQLRIMWNRVKDVAITLGGSLAPAIMDAIDAAEPFIKQIENGAKAFSDLDEEQQRTILKLIGLVAAVGPASMALGGISKVGGGLLTTFGRLSSSIGDKSHMSGKGGSLIGGLGLLGARGGPLALVTLGIAGATTAAMAFHKHMSQKLIPEVDLFGDEVSESTEQALGSFMDLNNEATVQLNELAWSGRTVTEEMAEEMTSTFEQMAEQIVGALEEQKDESLQAIQSLFDGAQEISIEEQAKMTESVEQAFEDRNATIEELTKEAEEILKRAAEENREIYTSEQIRLDEINREMKENAVTVMTETEKELLSIRRSMADQSVEISKNETVDTIKESANKRDKMKEEAEQLYHDQMFVLEELHKDATGEFKEQVEEMIRLAEEQRDETIEKADEMHDGVIEAAQERHPEILEEVSSLTGEVYTLWDRLGIDLTRRVAEILTDIKDRTTTAVGDVARIISGIKIAPKIDWGGLTRRTLSIGASSLFGSNADGTNYFNHPSGLSWLGEEGPELVRHGNKWALADFGLYSVPRGSQVFTNDETKKILQSLNNIPQYATGVSPPGEVNRIVNQLSNPQPVVGEAVIYTTVINQIDGREISRQTYKSTTEFQKREEFIKNKFGGALA